MSAKVTASNNSFGGGGQTSRKQTGGGNTSVKQDKNDVKEHGNTFGPGAGKGSSDGYVSTHAKTF